MSEAEEKLIRDLTGSADRLALNAAIGLLLSVGLISQEQAAGFKSQVEEIYPPED